ncbi:MAG: nucleotide-binding domain containing protein, partial [Planctomycetota bacterium]
LNPMTDANLVRFLGKQTDRQVGLLTTDAHDRLRDDSSELPFLIADACCDSDLLSLARAVADMPLVTGGSGLARFLPVAYREKGLLKSKPYEPAMPQIPGRGLVVAGSCSKATRTQVERFASECPGWQVCVESVLNDPESELQRLTAWASDVDADKPLFIYSSAAPEKVSELQGQFGTETASLAVEQFMAQAARTFVGEFEVTRLVLAGGETSGAIVRELGIRALAIGPEICAGVPWTVTLDEERPLALALKSGNFGGKDFFRDALEMLP